MIPRPPSWSQDGPKIPHLGSKMAPRPLNLEPRWHQDPPTWSQDGPKTLHPGAKMPPRPPILEPRWPQDPDFAAKMAQSTSKTPQLGAKMPPKSANFDSKCIPRPPNIKPKAHKLRQDLITSRLQARRGNWSPSSELGRVNMGAGGRGRSP